MSTLVQDIRFGLRMLAKNPVMTLAAIVTMALGIFFNVKPEIQPNWFSRIFGVEAIEGNRNPFDWVYNSVLVSRDIVAIDRIGTEKINAERARHSLPAIDPGHIRAAALPPYNLGTDDLGLIDLVVGCYISDSYPPYDDWENLIYYNTGTELEANPSWVSTDEVSTGDVQVAPLAPGLVEERGEEDVVPALDGIGVHAQERAEPRGRHHHALAHGGRTAGRADHAAAERNRSDGVRPRRRVDRRGPRGDQAPRARHRDPAQGGKRKLTSESVRRPVLAPGYTEN